MNLNYVYINDTFVESAQASLLISDLSIQRGYGIFDFFKTINGKPIFLEDHLERFYHSANKMHLDVGYTKEQLKSILDELLVKNNIPDAGIRITLTGGYATDGYTLAKPNMVITQQPLSLKLEIDPKGISLVTYPHQRQLSDVKTLDYLMAIWLQPFIKEQGADDVLYHADGLIKECPRSNFFIVNGNNEVITAQNHVLKGVIRKNVLQLNHPDFKVIERDFNLQELENATEAFITSTTKHILPVVGINGKQIGDGKAGSVTKKLSDLLLQNIRHQIG